MLFSRFLRHARPTWLAIVACGLAAALPSVAARAQAIAATVNGDPITTTEVIEQMSFLRIVKQPASREDALESLIADRIKLRQANRSGIDASEAALNLAFLATANKAGTTTAALLATFQRTKLNTDLIRTHLRSLAAWNEYIKSRNKSLAVSEEEVTAALAKNANLGKAPTDYQLQQIVFVVPVNATAAQVEQRMRDAQALRGRFQGCAAGLPLARALPDVAVKPPITRTSIGLPEATRKALQETGNGRLTAPSRTTSGIEMIAVCGTDDDVDRTSIRDNVQAQLLSDRLAREGDQFYKTLRATAVVEKR